MNDIEFIKQSLVISRAYLLVTVILAISTIVFSALNMAYQRSHNIKSVRPLCNIHQVFAQNSICVKIVNAGLGPMIIKKICLVKKGKEYSFSEVFSQLLDYDMCINHSEEYILAPNDEFILFKSKNSINDLDNIINQLEDYSILVSFKDIYDHQFIKKELINL